MRVPEKYAIMPALSFSISSGILVLLISLVALDTSSFMNIFVPLSFGAFLRHLFRSSWLLSLTMIGQFVDGVLFSYPMAGVNLGCNFHLLR